MPALISRAADDELTTHIANLFLANGLDFALAYKVS
jgi:hypothetical protein